MSEYSPQCKNLKIGSRYIAVYCCKNDRRGKYMRNAPKVLSSIFINAIILCTFPKQRNNLTENKCLKILFSNFQYPICWDVLNTMSQIKYINVLIFKYGRYLSPLLFLYWSLTVKIRYLKWILRSTLFIWNFLTLK